MASLAYCPKGTLVQRSPDGGTTWATIPECRNAKFNGSKANTDNVTNFDSVGNVEEYLSTTIDAGGLDFEMNDVPGNATQALVLADFNAETRSSWQVVLPSAAGTYGFLAFVSSADLDLSPTKAAVRSVKLKITSIITKS
jgi:hypothetical protein